ncbi:MAG: hypothetical protein ACEPOW_12665 [Bacteroidales bacterium]
MNRFMFYKSLYDRELHRKEFLINSANVPIGILTALVVVCAFLLKEFNYETHYQWCYFLFLVFISLGILSIILSISYLMKAMNNMFRGFKYYEIPHLNFFEKKHTHIMQSYKPNIILKNRAENEFEEYIIQNLVKFTDIHTMINDKRSKQYFLCRRFLVISLLFFIIASIPFLITLYETSLSQ